MIVVIKRPGEDARLEDIGTELEDMQAVVDGYIEVVGFGDGVLMCVNEDGKLRGLEPNFWWDGDIIRGTVFFCRTREDEFAGLTDRQAEKVLAVVNRLPGA